MVGTHLGIGWGAVVVRLPPKAEDLPQEDAVAPDVTLLGELKLTKTLWSIPAQHAERDQATLSSNFLVHWVTPVPSGRSK